MGYTFAPFDGTDPAAFAAGLDDARLVTDRLLRDYVAGTGAPGWCWTAYDDQSRPVARHHWWGPTTAEPPSAVTQLQVLDVDAAAALLAHARETLEVGDAWSELTLAADVDGDPWTELPHLVDSLERAGFTFQVARVRVDRSGSARELRPERLRFRPVTDVDEELLVSLFAAVTDGSLDHSMRTDRERYGREHEARRRSRFVRSYPGVADRMVVGVDGSGEVVGYVAPAFDNGVAVIAEIGVAADHRGHGYVHDLLAHATRALTDAGADRIVADTDCDNTPMRAAFAAAGYREFARRWDWGWRQP